MKFVLAPLRNASGVWELECPLCPEIFATGDPESVAITCADHMTHDHGEEMDEFTLALQRHQIGGQEI